MKGKGFFAKDKTEEIIGYYPIAGFGLRLGLCKKLLMHPTGIDITFPAL